MSSEISTKGKKKPAPEAEPVDERVPGFQPWHLFVIGTLMASAAAAIAVRGTRPANVVFVCLTVVAAGVAAYAVYRTLWPLVEPDSVDTPEMLGGRTRAALEREKTLVLRAIKELEFDRAMGKVSEADFQEMTARLRTRAVRLIRQLDSGSAAYRELIEKELAARQASAAKAPAGGRQGAAAKAVIAVVLLGSLAAGTPVRAQMGGMGGAAGMPDAKGMSGIPRPEASVRSGPSPSASFAGSCPTSWRATRWSSSPATGSRRSTPTRTAARSSRTWRRERWCGRLRPSTANAWSRRTSRCRKGPAS